MHRCLTIEEIFLVILAHAGAIDPITIYEKERQNQNITLADMFHTDFRTLHSLALTCKTFKEPALDQLWHRQFGLGNLIRLMPEDLWVESVVGPQHIFIDMDFRRPPVPADWVRFDSYARRVKSLNVSGFEARRFTTPIRLPSLDILNAFRSRGNPVLPALEALSWSTTFFSGESLKCFDIFLGRSMVDFALETEFSIQDLAEDNLDIPRIPSLSPGLKELALHLFGTPTLKAQLPNLVSSLRNLRSFHCHFDKLAFSHDMITALSTLPALENLELSVDAIEEHGPVQILDPLPSALRPTRTRFLTLQRLELATPFSSKLECAEVLRTMDLPALKSFEINDASVWMLRKVLEELNACCTPHAFKELKINDRSDGGYLNATPLTLTASDLKLLEKFRRLEILDITCPFDLTDADMKNCAAWWPALEEFSLGRNGWVSTQLTMDGLAALAEGCPNLRELDLAFDASQPANFNAPRSCNEHVTRLGVADSFIEGDAHEDIADRLLALFPNLDTIETSKYDTLSEVEWDVVQHCLPNFTP